MFIGRTDAEAEIPILWPSDVKNWLIGKDPNAGKEWRQEENGTTKDEMVRGHHQLDGHELEQALGVGDGQGGLACCTLWCHKESETTERVNWTEMIWSIKWKWKSLRYVQLFVTPWTIQSMAFSRSEYWGGNLSLLQGIFPAKRSHPGLLHCRQILYELSHKGNPRTLEWVAYPFSSRSSWPRNRTGVSCIAGEFFTN